VPAAVVQTRVPSSTMMVARSEGDEAIHSFLLVFDGLLRWRSQ
jgi:hypothetical protein